jgi:hypothetical protein
MTPLPRVLCAFTWHGGLWINAGVTEPRCSRRRSKLNGMAIPPPAMTEDGNPSFLAKLPSSLALIHSDDLRLNPFYFIREARKRPYVGACDGSQRHNIRA